MSVHEDVCGHLFFSMWVCMENSYCLNVLGVCACICGDVMCVCASAVTYSLPLSRSFSAAVPTGSATYIMNFMHKAECQH